MYCIQTNRLNTPIIQFSRSSYSEVCDHGSGNSSGNGSLDKCMSPVGRLKSAVNKWKLIDSNAYILTVGLKQYLFK